MTIVNQPFNGFLGFKLMEQLDSKKFNRFTFSVAYAKTSGVYRLLPYMKDFQSNGGIIKAIVGIDQSNTSYEALIALCSVCDSLFVYHSEDFKSTFHVKAYLLSGSHGNWIAVGSNNFTAGGLFSNYEASVLAVDDTALETEIVNMFDQYSNPSSPCCKAADAELIDQLLAQGYIQRESALAKQRLLDANRSKVFARQGGALFGHDSIAPLPQIPAGNARPVFHPISEELPVETDYLIRHVPRAGNRSKQVHFTLDILENYFRLSVGDDLSLQEIDNDFVPHELEYRQIVLSSRNRNVKVEVSAAEVLDRNYPADPEKRPILLFKRINPTMFEYMLLMDGDLGYSALNQRLLALDWHKRSLPYEIVDTSTMLTIWENCPLI